MSFILLNELDRIFITKLTQDIKILTSSKMDWTIQDVTRFANLLKIDDAIGSIIKDYDIDGNKLFDIEYLIINLESIIRETNFFPLNKMFFVVDAILEISGDVGSDRHAQDKHNQKNGKMNQLEQENWFQIEEGVIVRLKEELNKIGNMPIIQLGTTQLYRLLRSASFIEQSEHIKKWNVDGFSLISILPNQSSAQLIRNYYSDQQIKILQKLSHIFIHLYYHQHYQIALQNPINHQKINNFQFIEDFNVEFHQINFLPNQNYADVKRSMGNSEYGTSEAGDFRQSKFGTSEPGELRNSEYGTSEPGELRNSEYGTSERGSLKNSQYGVSQRGSIRNSEYGVSERGSIRNSMAESQYAGSEIMQDEDSTRAGSRQGKVGEIRISSNEDDSSIAALSAVTMKLPFNLLDLQPLQKIKISNIPYPFSFSKGGFTKKDTKIETAETINHQTAKNECIYNLIEENEDVREFKVFNLSGAKFGRAPDNDFSYPDELSISGKHAQIVFKDQSYYLRDLGSKTGTFVYISQTKPLTLSDQQVIQLSYEIQMKVMIIKNDINEGVIKFQFKKPQNQPPYRAILKNNNTVRIGKAQKSHIRLTNQSISNYHAEIKYQQGKFIMYDCNTRTGTWLRLSNKGVRSGDRKLSKHDIIRISSKKTFLIEDVTDGISFNVCCEGGRKKQ